MGPRSHARSRAGARAPLAVVASRVVCAASLLGSVGCGDSSLDDVRDPLTSASGSTTSGGTLPPLDSGPASTGEASTGEPVEPDDPRLCAAECPLVLPVSWEHHVMAGARALEGQPHAVPAMLREADGTLTVAELRDGQARLHRLDGEGRLQWNVPLPLPCDSCELTDVARHPSGDLLLSATGSTEEGGLSLFAARYDAREHALVWLSRRPLDPLDGVWVRSGGIVALSDDVVGQLYMRGVPSFGPLQSTRVAAYGSGGVLLDEEELVLTQGTSLRPPLLARATPDGEMLVAVLSGTDFNPYGLIDRIQPPLWHETGFAFALTPLDDVRLDERGHALELGHRFDGTRAHLLLSNRVAVDDQPSWVATVAVASTSVSTAALALGPDGDVYAAMRTTLSPGETGDPLAGLALVRWTSQGELRWSTTILHAMAESFSPVELAIDDDEGLVIATVVEDRLLIERRAQHCACGAG